MRLIGYGNEWRAKPGHRIDFRVSSATAYDVDYVRLTRGATAPGTVPSNLAPARFPSPPRQSGRVQTTGVGSYVRVPHSEDFRLPSFTAGAWINATRTALEAVGILSSQETPDGPGWALVLAGDRVGLHVGGVASFTCWAAERLPLNQWRFVAIAVHESSAAVHVGTTSVRWAWHDLPAAGIELVRADLFIGARCHSQAGSTPEGKGHFDGRIESPAIYRGIVTEGDVASAWAEAPGSNVDLVAAWDFSRWGDSRDALDVTSRHHGIVVNSPGRAVRGHLFDGSSVDFRERPEHYGAIHFHSDDVEDAGWEVDFSLDVPDDAPSGLYAARLVSEEGASDYLPFVVPPKLGAAVAPVLILLPTLTYLAYGNERFHRAPYVRWHHASDRPLELSAADAFTATHPEVGPSLYDVHPDGSINTYASRWRPTYNFRPYMRSYWNGSSRHLAADLYLIELLNRVEIEHEVATDEDLDDYGARLLAPYRVVVLGSHPEYWTLEMLKALEAYLDGGGRVMYLGGNGMWWVTSRDPHRPHIIEVRKSDATGVVPGLGVPGGESMHSTTGEAGGTWRERGRSPERLVGVAYASQGFSSARPYRRTDASRHPAFAELFAGIADDELIGDFGLAMGGAAGDEFDRVDYALGSPPQTVVLASSSDHDAYCMNYSLPYEPDDVRASRVRSDIALLPLESGGAVFAAGSMCWIPALPVNGYRNNVAQLTENVLRRFLDPAPIHGPEHEQTADG